MIIPQAIWYLFFLSILTLFTFFKSIALIATILMQMKLAKSSHPVADHNFEIVPAISPMEIRT